jgi:hypothetical protein
MAASIKNIQKIIRCFKRKTLMKKISREEIYNQDLIEVTQPEGTGCMWYSMYSLTGNEVFKQYENENSSDRFMIKVQEEGYFLWPLFAVPPSFYLQHDILHELLNFLKHKNYITVKIIISEVKKTKKEPNGIQHVVAAQFDITNGNGKLLDPVKGFFESLTWDGLLIRCPMIFEILVLDSGDPEDYASIPSHK